MRERLPTLTLDIESPSMSAPSFGIVVKDGDTIIGVLQIAELERLALQYWRATVQHAETLARLQN